MKALLTSIALVAASTAHAGPFSGAYAPANWMQSTGSGSVDSFTPAELTITGGDDAGGFSSFTDVYVQVQSDALVSFDWSYSTSDSLGAGYDPFGYIWSDDGLNFFFAQLTDDNGASAQSGTASFMADAGTWFGFRAWTLDNTGGAATTTITNFSVPEPSSYALAAIALLGVAAARRRQSA